MGQASFGARQQRGGIAMARDGSARGERDGTCDGYRDGGDGAQAMWQQATPGDGSARRVRTACDGSRTGRAMATATARDARRRQAVAGWQCDGSAMAVPREATGVDDTQRVVSKHACTHRRGSPAVAQRSSTGYVASDDGGGAACCVRKRARGADRERELGECALGCARSAHAPFPPPAQHTRTHLDRAPAPLPRARRAAAAAAG